MFRSFSPTAVSLALLMSVVPAFAQAPRAERPYRGLFGGGIGDTEQLLTASASFGGGYDDNLIADARGQDSLPQASDLNTTFRGSVGQVSGGLQYSLRRSRLDFGATGGTSARYYPSLGRDLVRRDNASVGTTVRLVAGLSANASAAYAPYSLASLFAVSGDPSVGDSGPFDDDFASSDQHRLVYGGGLNFSHKLSDRTTFSADYGYRARNSSNSVEPFTRHTAGGGLSHSVGKGLAVTAGYHYVKGQYGASSGRLANHLIDAGVDYNRNLSFTRRTTLSFGTGTTATARPNELGGKTKFRLKGHVALNHEMGRTWNAALVYSRGVLFNESWPVPASSDSVTASLVGLLSRRLQFQSSARTTTGRAGLRDTGNGFNGYYGTALLGFALSRHLSLQLRYGYYRHRFDDLTLLVPGFTNAADRHSVRGYISLWAPIFQRARRSDATR